MARGLDPLPDATSRRVQARGVATRARLLEGAEALFVEKGYEATSVAEIAQRAGVGVGTLYHHFPDKRALLLERIEAWVAWGVAERRGRDVPGSVRAGPLEPRQLVDSWIRSIYEREVKHPSLWWVVADMAGRDPAVAERFRAMQRSGRERVQQLIEAFQERGAIRAGLDPSSAAYVIRDVLERMGTRFLRGESHDVDRDRVLVALIDMICRYLFDEGQRGDEGGG
jgi:AcrR family transcriptional regulator